MSRIKEIRRQIIESKSPLRRHSLNQRKIKEGLEGDIRHIHRRVKVKANEIVLDKQENTDVNPRVEKLTEDKLPLTKDFLFEMLPSMINIASERIMEEENKISSIPVRMFRILTDVQRIYKLAKKKGKHLNMVDHSRYKESGSESIVYPALSNHPRYPDLFDYMNYLVSTARFIGRQHGQQSFSTDLFKALRINLTSCNFSLRYEDQVPERIKTYSYLIANLALAAENHLKPEIIERKLDAYFLDFLESIKKPLLKK